MDYHKYAQNLESYEMLDQITFEKGTPKEEVIKALIDNSNEKRKIALENNAILDEYLYKYVKNPDLMDDEAAEKLADFYKTFTPQPQYSMDPAIGMEATEVLYKYYAGKKDYDKTIKFMYLSSIYQLIMDQHVDIGSENPFYDLTISLKPFYNTLSEEGKKNFVSLYCKSINDRSGNNLISKYEGLVSFLKENGFDTENTMHLANSTCNVYDFVITINIMKRRYEIFKKESIFPEFDVSQMKAIHTDAMSRLHCLPEVYQQLILVHEPEYQYFIGACSFEEATNKIKNMTFSTEELPEELIVRNLILPYTLYLRFIHCYGNYPEAKLKEICKAQLEEATNKLQPYMHQDTDITMNYYYLTLLSIASEIIGLEEYLPILENLTIMSNKSLFIHTKMVAELSMAIFDAMYDENPTFFTGVRGYDEDYVRNHKDELRNLLYKSAMLHDFGKFFLLDIIGNSSRKLTDYEFFLIQHHPLNITDIYEAPPTENEKVIIDVSHLHHLWFNEQGGYPKGYHQTENKPFVSIVAVADSIDAATDFIGRPYAKRKTIDDIVGEIILMKGTRYDAKVADAIEKPLLKEKIRHIIEERRTEINYEVYTDNKD